MIGGLEMNTDIVVIGAGLGIKDRITVKVGGVEVEPIELLKERLFGVPYGAEVTITNNSSDLLFNLYFYMSEYVVMQIGVGVTSKFIAVRDMMIRDIPASSTSDIQQ